jgi:hypothetical protein
VRRDPFGLGPHTEVLADLLTTHLDGCDTRSVDSVYADRIRLD